MKQRTNLRKTAVVALCALALSPAALVAGNTAKAAEERGWKASIAEKEVKTKALKDAGIKVMAPSAELKSGLAKIGETIAKEWEQSAGADGAAMLAAFKK